MQLQRTALDKAREVENSLHALLVRGAARHTGRKNRLADLPGPFYSPSRKRVSHSSRTS